MVSKVSLMVVFSLFVFFVIITMLNIFGQISLFYSSFSNLIVSIFLGLFSILLIVYHNYLYDIYIEEMEKKFELEQERGDENAN